MIDGGEERDAFAQLGRLAREAAGAPVDPREDATGRRRLMVATEDRLPVRRFRYASRVRPLWLAGFASLAIAAAGGLYLHWQARALTYRVEGGAILAANYVEAKPDTRANVKFSDGTEIDARPGARLRIDETRSDGARVFVERGTAAARVKHRERSRWMFVAGPFDVRVIGTKFDLNWDPDAQAVSLTLHEGAVEVHSPVGQSHCVVRAGQRFRASLRTGTMTLENIEQSVARAPASTPPAWEPTEARASQAPEPRAKPVGRATSSKSRASELAPPREWMKLVRSGAFQAVVDAALSTDLDTLLSQRSAAEVRALADAARYTNKNDLAERSLLALRERFPHSRDSAAAAFLLGRTSESRGQFERAERWYRQYADESPSGEYAADALAGRMRSVAGHSGDVAAEALAREYVRRFPRGVHVEAAKRLSRQP